ncbi:MAG: hypothetical protein QJR09_08050 [Micrococcus sp.]|nr:hypothetical protein [Micrococcus sp.]
MPRWRIKDNHDEYNGTVTADWITMTSHHVVAWEDQAGRDVILTAIPIHPTAQVKLLKDKKS